MTTISKLLATQNLRTPVLLDIPWLLRMSRKRMLKSGLEDTHCVVVTQKHHIKFISRSTLAFLSDAYIYTYMIQLQLQDCYIKEAFQAMYVPRGLLTEAAT